MVSYPGISNSHIFSYVIEEKVNNVRPKSHTYMSGPFKAIKDPMRHTCLTLLLFYLMAKKKLLTNAGITEHLVQ